MSVNTSLSANLEPLRRRRGHRRGQVTKIKKKVKDMTESDPDDWEPDVAGELLEELVAHKTEHDAIQMQIDEIYDKNPECLVDEEEERDKHADIHKSLKLTLIAIPKAKECWVDCGVLLDDIDMSLGASSTDSDHFKSAVDSLTARNSTLQAACTHHFKLMPPLKDRCLELKGKIRDAIATVRTNYRGPSASSPTPAVTSPPPTHSSNNLSLHIEVPTFTGNPLEWEEFESQFVAAITTRAKGQSDKEIKNHLLRAVKNESGKKLLTNMTNKEAGMEEMLDILRKKFGSPAVISPILIKSILSILSIDFSESDLELFHENFVLPFQRFVSLIDNNLSSYLAYRAIAMMTPECRRMWLQSKYNDGDIPDMDRLAEFTKHWLESFAMSGKPTSSASLPSTYHASNATARPRPPSNPAPRKSSPGCIVCGESHVLSRCSTFLSYDTDKRNKVVRERRLCLNCFSDNHGFRSCPSRFSCRSCRGRHHTLLHRDRDSTAPATSAPQAPVMTATMKPELHSDPASTATRQAKFLYSAVVSMHNGDRTVRARALLDGGAAISMITEKLASDLRLKRTHDPTSISGIAGTTHCKFTVVSPLCSANGQYQTDPIHFTVIPSLGPLVTPSNRDQIMENPKMLQFNLADPDLGGPVDLVLGVDQTTLLTTDKPFQIDQLHALPTRLGLCLSGPLQVQSSIPSVMTATAPDNLQDNLALLWELDQVKEAPSLSPENEQVVSHFANTHTRVQGRFCVCLPRVPDPPLLGDTRRQALSRLHANERTLKAKDELLAFSAVLQEYLDLGHAEIIPHHQLLNTPNCYLPVLGVFKESSTTTKIRAVFDASAKSSSGSSLNDTLLPGPNMYPPLSDVLIRFRCHPIGMSADISKMFREILLDPSERDWHRFLMRTNDGLIRDCRMLRLTFGVKSSPYLATQVLRTIAEHHITSHPLAAHSILTDFYVDDVLTGADTVPEAQDLREQLCDLLAQAGMVLRKWRTNSPELLSTIPPDLREKQPEPLSILPSSQAPKALGVHWDVDLDTLHIAVPNDPSPTSTITKRTIAAGTAGIFDVMGLFCPFVVSARILFQETWKLGLAWDGEVPEEISDRWTAWLSDLPLLNRHPVPRRLTPDLNSPIVSKSLQGFADASSTAYGCAIYLRSVCLDGSICTTLVLAKARVLPVKLITIPRAELLAAHLLARLLDHASKLLCIPHLDITAWTDSEIVLHWLPKSPHLLDRFVANRVQAIQESLPGIPWRHVSSEHNPADLASRGVRARDLISSTLWWSGPPWLSQPASSWPQHRLSKLAVPVFRIDIKPCHTLPTDQLLFLDGLWSRYSNFFYLVRIVCFLFRFMCNCRRSQQQRTSGQLTFEEIERTKFRLYQLSQSEHHPEVFAAIRKDKPLPRDHRLAKYHLVLSAHGHLLAQSRVRDPLLPTRPLQLTLLHPKSKLTKLLMRSLHIVYGHAGVTAMASILSHTYLIPALRNLLKLVSRTCPTCQRAYARPLVHPMGLLPLSRTTPDMVFNRVGIDFAGPFTLKVGHTRRPSYLKAYVVVFVCLVTKAIHLDICSSLSTEEFLATLSRFVSRRGCPAQVFSDNGSNFLGAREEIRELQVLLSSASNAISHFANRNNIDWNLIPPRTPHFGGLWEAAVKSMKIHLKKNLKPHPLRWDEMYTILTEAEAILNSRPLAPLHAEEAEEGTYLTAGHFLIGRPLRAQPSKPTSTAKLSDLRRWNLVNRIKEDLWRQWCASYLSSCAQRVKWTERARRRLQTGDLVFVKDETLKVRDWPVAIVEAIHPGSDGEVRVVTIRCRGRTYKRPTVKMIPFYTDQDEAKTSPASPPGSMSRIDS